MTNNNIFFGLILIKNGLDISAQCLKAVKSFGRGFFRFFAFTMTQQVRCHNIIIVLKKLNLLVPLCCSSARPVQKKDGFIIGIVTIDNMLLMIASFGFDVG